MGIEANDLGYFKKLLNQDLDSIYEGLGLYVTLKEDQQIDNLVNYLYQKMGNDVLYVIGETFNLQMTGDGSVSVAFSSQPEVNKKEKETLAFNICKKYTKIKKDNPNFKNLIGYYAGDFNEDVEESSSFKNHIQNYYSKKSEDFCDKAKELYEAVVPVAQVKICSDPKVQFLFKEISLVPDSIHKNLPLIADILQMVINNAYLALNELLLHYAVGLFDPISISYLAIIMTIKGVDLFCQSYWKENPHQ